MIKNMAFANSILKADDVSKVDIIGNEIASN
jgi:hypothetical protein